MQGRGRAPLRQHLVGELEEITRKVKDKGYFPFPHELNTRYFFFSVMGRVCVDALFINAVQNNIVEVGYSEGLRGKIIIWIDHKKK